MKEAHNEEKTVEQVLNMPLYKFVWSHWHGLAYYQMNHYYTKIEDVPAGIESYHLVEGNQINNYRLFKGEYELAGSWTKELCKKLYGTDIIG